MKTIRTYLFGMLAAVTLASSVPAFNALSAGHTAETFVSSPCTDCLQRAQDNYATCINGAGSDDARKTACLEALNTALTNCKLTSGCP